MNMCIIVLVCSMTFFGCKTYENFKDEQEFKKQGREILDTPNLNENNNH
jgi:hypothetical protein